MRFLRERSPARMDVKIIGEGGVGEEGECCRLAVSATAMTRAGRTAPVEVGISQAFDLLDRPSNHRSYPLLLLFSSSHRSV